MNRLSIALLSLFVAPAAYGDMVIEPDCHVILKQSPAGPFKFQDYSHCLTFKVEEPKIHYRTSFLIHPRPRYIFTEDCEPQTVGGPCVEHSPQVWYQVRGEGYRSKDRRDYGNVIDYWFAWTTNEERARDQLTEMRSRNEVNKASIFSDTF